MQLAVPMMLAFSPAVWAANTIAVDTRAEEGCKASHNMWVALDDNVPECINEYGQKAMDECHAKGGMYAKFSASSEDSAGIPYCRPSDQQTRKEKCIANGGEWHRLGMANVPGCITHFDDANKDCQSNDDCKSKKCLAAETSIWERIIGNEHGKCAPTDDSFGCFSYFEKNSDGTRTNVCVD